MRSSAPSLLRRALLADAAVSGATGVLMLLGAGLLEGLLDVPAPLLRYAGSSLLPFALFVGGLSRRESQPRARVWAVIALNVAWAAGSVLLLVGGAIAPSPLGSAFVMVQAVAVAGFAELQYFGLRRSAVSAG